ncbi:MAG: T9SS type A sorting domain-containing protein, partial [Promethearchaeota archaeon]
IVNQINNNTITGNVADTAGGIHLEGGLNLILLNNICWGNNAPFSPEIYVKGGTMEIAYSNIRFGKDSIQVNTGGTLNWLSGNINTDPQFLPDDTLFHLTPSTVNLCVNSGTDSLLMGGIMVKCPMDDYDGDVRPFPGTMPDMGADETDLPSSIILTQGTEIPQTYILHQNYPNPFNPSTTIEFTLPKSAFVTMKVYNLLGEEVATLVSENLSAGKYKYLWDASQTACPATRRIGMASGVYLYQLEAGEFKQAKKLILMK